MAEPDLVVIALHIEAAIASSWFEEVRRLAVDRVRRMMVIERPDTWIVRCEMERGEVDGFCDVLQDAWTVFNAMRRPVAHA